MYKLSLIILSFLIISLLFSCAFDIVHVKQVPTQLELTEFSRNPLLLENEVTDISIGTGYSRKLRQGTKWDYVGYITEGDIYKTKDQILTIEGSNIYEAYIVVSENKLVGFYLPVEQTFSPLEDSKEIQFKEIDINQ